MTPSGQFVHFTKLLFPISIAVKRIRSDKRMDQDCYLRIINQFIVELQAMHTFPGENILLLLYYSFSEDLSTEPCLVYQVSWIQFFEEIMNT